MLEVRETEGRGRGVFATEALEAGVVVEECAVIVIPACEVAALLATRLRDYFFRWGGVGDEAALALGHGSLFNHSPDANAMYVRKHEERLISFVTLRRVKAGEEVTVNYNGGFGDTSPVWFDAK